MYRVVILDRRSSRVKYVRVGEYLTFDLCNRLSFYLGHEDTMTIDQYSSGVSSIYILRCF